MIMLTIYCVFRIDDNDTVFINAFDNVEQADEYIWELEGSDDNYVIQETLCKLPTLGE